jgi:NADH-ubiquinone oxidoreductase chain 5
MMLAFITKRAIYPFSPWLPLAIAAPTPISALVHSSTLVTAGLYLLIRFSYVFYRNVTLINIFLVLSIFTSFYAGINSIFEIDIKKLIALSTLSHLGFIGMAYSSGLLYLSFFHLLVHALFKSLLFIAIGDVITNLFHSQDIRFLSGGYNYTTSSYYTIVLRFLNLLGMPSIRGYYSKDLVLETLNFTSFRFFILLVVYLNLFFTYYYTYQLFYYSFSSIKLTPFVLQHPSTLIHSYLLLILGVVGVVFGWVWVNFVNFYVIHITTPLFSKIYPLLLSITVFSFLVFNLRLLKPSNPLLLFFFSNIMLLSCLIITLISNLYLKITFFSVKSFEQGFLDNVLNKSTSRAFTVVSSVVFKLLNLNSLLLSFFTLSTFIFFMFL